MFMNEVEYEEENNSITDRGHDGRDDVGGMFRQQRVRDG